VRHGDAELLEELLERSRLVDEQEAGRAVAGVLNVWRTFGGIATDVPALPVIVSRSSPRWNVNSY